MSLRISRGAALGASLILQLSAAAALTSGCAQDAADGGGDEIHVTAERIDRGTVEADTAPAIDDADYSKLIKQLNHFGLELGAKQAQANKLTTTNNVYSPLSAAIALAMTYNGARGDTATEMGKLLAGDLASDTFHSGVNRLSRELASRALRDKDASEPKRIELDFADALYVDTSLEVEQPFLNDLSKHYDAGVHRVDFLHAFEPARVQINDWVAAKTHDQIQNLLPEDAVSEQTRFVLVNALYFYGSWSSPFSAEATSDADFQTLAGDTVSVPTMYDETTMSYAAGSGFSVVDLPYVGGHLSMAVVLPDEGQFETVRAGMTGEWLDTTLGSLSDVRVALALPKFKLVSDSVSLSAPLQAMGMETAFTDNADFSGITGSERLSISDVLQKAFVAVDEAGTEAAAATAAIGGVGSARPTEIVRFSVDRPFLFVIHDNSGAVLFTGHVVNPSLDE
jgi:serpin B